MDVAQATLFRDKDAMKQAVDRGGDPHAEAPARHDRRRVPRAAEQIGFPVIVKPIAGAGSADTYRVRLRGASSMRCSRAAATSREVSVEEFIDGEEYTFDTICIDGEDPVLEHLPGTARAR